MLPQMSRSSDPSLWRTRDMVDELRSHRIPSSSPSAVTPSMSLSSHFDVDTCLARIRRDKASVVRAAFEASAISVVQALEIPEDDEDLEDVDEDDLPFELSQWKKLENLRVTCLERSRDNKEVSKQKKGSKALPSLNTTSSNVVAIKTSLGGASTAATAKSTTIKSTNTATSNNGGGGGDATPTSTTATGNTKKKGQPDPNKPKRGGKAGSARDSTPKFTRNTPAASAAALDSRSTNSRAILCAAANITFAELTPPLPDHDIDVMDVPQNPARAIPATTASTTTAEEEEENSKVPSVNMGAVLLQAQTLGNRATAVAKNAARRSAQRYQYRKDNARYHLPKTRMLRVNNPFAWKDENADGDDDDDFDDDADESMMFSPSEDSSTETWESTCLPRFYEIMHTGMGHVLYHDLHWRTRHGRIANLLWEVAQRDDNFGPHLIITTEPELEYYAREFRDVNSHLQLLTTVHHDALRMIHYRGSKAQRRKLRRYFVQAKGLADDPFHVVITSYADFLQDYLHFCQVPFQVALVDDGLAFLAAAQGDLNSSLGVLWESAMWSASDQRIGLAGTTLKEWDFTKDDLSDETIKEAWIGLTARYRIVTASNMYVEQRSSIDLVSVSGLVSLISPQFSEIVREEWDRSRIASDQPSLEHMRKLLSRSMVVHYPDADDRDMYELAFLALKGRLPSPDRTDDLSVPDVIPDELFVSEGKVTQSRRSSLTWLGPAKSSWLRYELGMTSFQHILNAMKMSNVFGHVCQEITTASSTTSSGATGQVTGTLAFRLAVRCGRHFGSEPGLRQHMSALHAPPGTWLCRTCGGDCITSQARTHHERSCGQPSAGAPGPDEGGSMSGGTPTVGQGVGSARGRQHHGPVGVVGKKKGGKGGGAGATKDKDPDGSVRVPTYRGVWVNQGGKHFIKFQGKRFNETNGDTMFFDTVEDAARKYDELTKSKGGEKNHELNFKDDGTRVTYKEETPPSAVRGVEMLGGAADNVVPALSVINIKDLPPDIKPLLRDPRQTSRTGGNSKRHVYAYRGVCRQARKGHDRWQSQISFMGVNHYLGTFDSEWDAAAIYAWAHLILYGEEATKKAQREGEEAAAAYEQEKKDIAAGKIPDPPPKPEKKKRKPSSKSEKGSGDDKEHSNEQKESNEDEESSAPSKKKRLKEGSTIEKKPRTVAKTTIKVDKESIVPLLSKGTAKVQILGPRHAFRAVSDEELELMAFARITAFRKRDNGASDMLLPAPHDERLQTCAPVKPGSRQSPPGGAMLLGLSSVSFGWNVSDYVASQYFESSEREEMATLALTDEYDSNGFNEKFRTVIQGSMCVIGRSTKQSERFHSSLVGNVEIGGPVGKLDCNIGGTMKSCSEAAALIRYFPTTSSSFQFSAIAEDDLVTLNGQRIRVNMGSFPLFNEDVCTVGARVFVFLLPMDK